MRKALRFLNQTLFCFQPKVVTLRRQGHIVLQMYHFNSYKTMKKEMQMMTLPRTKTMVRRSQAAERRILQNKQHMDKYAWNLCKRLKEYYAMALTWMGNPLEQTGGFTFTERGGKVHSGMTRLQTYYVEMERDLTPSGRIGEWSQIVHIFTFAVFEDGYKVGLRLDIPLMLMNAEAPQSLVECPPSGDFNELAYDDHADGFYLIMRFHPTLQCFVPAVKDAQGECSSAYMSDYEPLYF